MVRMRYTGLVDAHAAFESLRPFRNALIAIKRRYRPFGADYLVIDVVMKALDTAAYHFTREPDFYTMKPEQSRPPPPPDPA